MSVGSADGYSDMQSVQNLAWQAGVNTICVSKDVGGLCIDNKSDMSDQMQYYCYRLFNERR